MNYIAFDTDIAEYMTSQYYSVLGTEKMRQITRELKLPEHEGTFAREWLTKDLMILATADYMQCDTVLTLDERTFLPMTQKVGYFCCVAKQERFNANDKYIFEYNG